MTKWQTRQALYLLGLTGILYLFSCKSQDNELRTRTYNVRVGDKVWVDGQPAFSVKGGGNRFDVYTMKEMIVAFYGENCKCIIIEQSGRKVVIE